MKKIIAISMFLALATMNLKAQSIEWSSNLVDVLYAGYNNVLPLKFVDVNKDKVTLSVTEGELFKNDKGRYVWKSKRGGHFETLTAKVNNKIIGEFKMKFVRFPDPIAEIFPKNANLKNWQGIKCVLPNVKLNMPTSIQSYIIQITRDGDVTNLTNRGGKLTDENRRQLKYVDEKASVMLTKVYGRCPGDKAGRRINDVRLQ